LIICVSNIKIIVGQNLLKGYFVNKDVNVRLRLEGMRYELLKKKAKEQSMSTSAYIRSMASIGITTEMIIEKMESVFKRLGEKVTDNKIKNSKEIVIADFTVNYLSFIKDLILDISKQIQTLTSLENMLKKDYENIQSILEGNFSNALETIKNRNKTNESENNLQMLIYDILEKDKCRVEK